MPEWLRESFGVDEPISAGVLAVRLVIALGLGFVISAIYRFTRRGHEVPAAFPPTLVLLAVLIAMVTQVVGEHVARAFSLVGALSIVRFRTVVDDTLDIGFVIFAVVVGMAVGADHLAVALVGTVVIGAALVLVRPQIASGGWSQFDSNLSVRVGIGQDPDALVRDAFQKHLERFTLVGAETGRQGSALDISYRVRLRQGSTPVKLVTELNGIEGIQSVDLNRPQ
jgi:Domain of unknown function (DUF4956)